MHLGNNWLWLGASLGLLGLFFREIIKAAAKDAYGWFKRKLQRPKRLKPTAVSTSSATIKFRRVQDRF
jgi:hypothetical protein